MLGVIVPVIEPDFGEFNVGRLGVLLVQRELRCEPRIQLFFGDFKICCAKRYAPGLPGSFTVPGATPGD